MVDNSLQDEYLGTFIEETLERWAEDTSLLGRKLVMQEIIGKAKDSSRSSPEHAREILMAGETLYGDDPSVADLVAECRRLQEDLPSQPSALERAEPAAEPFE